MGKHSQKQSGFTLIEILIVVIILAILAVLIIPLFTASSQDAKEAALKTNLSNWRRVIDLYYLKHGSTYPGAVKDG